MQTHLAEGGTGFQQVLDRVRLSLARKYLTYSELRISQIAELLRFSETSAFTRFFKTREGMTPKDYRRIALSRESLP